MRRRQILPLLIIALCSLLLLYRLSEAPPLWFDEGWPLLVARTWVETGEYGRLLNGQIAPGGAINIGLPIILPVYLMFKVFGVGAVQARLPGVVYTIATMLVFYHLMKRVFGGSVAKWSVLAALLTLPGPSLNPLLVGRQVLGEMPAMFFLLCGYLVLSHARDRWAGYAILGGFFWGLSATCKLQVLPFLLAALAIPLIGTIGARYWSSVPTIVMGMLASVASTMLIRLASGMWLGEANLLQLDVGQLATGMIVFNVNVRATVLLLSLPTAFPAGLSLIYWLIHQRQCKINRWLTMHGWVAVSLWSLAFLWLVWYLLLSVGWQRYLFPALFVGSPFLAILVRRYTFDANLGATIRAAALMFRWPISVERVGSLVVLLFLATSVPMTVLGYWYAYIIHADRSVEQLATYLNTESNTESLVESYDMELFFVLDRRFHYPPDDVQTVLNQRYFLGLDVTLVYDIDDYRPDYIVVGPHSKMWGLYDSALASGRYHLLASYPRYSLYSRNFSH